MLKKVVFDFLWGLFLIFAVLLIEMLVTLPFVSGMLNLEFVLTSVPGLLVAFLLAGFLRTSAFKEAIRRSVLWTVMLLLFYVLIGIGNDTLQLIFAGFGIYLLLAAVFLGPILWWRIKGGKS